ncbi:unnamed protein product [Kuraishia capsulata CBS 1993]|uniref:PRELI/MSF1 domain-containing protein n=1 Tax=Kuraishia capsulata CBS 1993 TaxID=1382522 RepID=W6MRQ9_9ASCO|nr:uncharacterized protein KUCA_T00000458001 [Kuraishia capsulata CBS 1993]CDK24495.1 unnamed protein product [Kuraishia capsulata CBS 1993]
MVLVSKSEHNFEFDFPTVTLAYFNRYPNPFSTHVLSCDTISKRIDTQGNLHQTKLIVKTGRLPKWIAPFLGSRITSSCIIEHTVVNPLERTMMTYTRNLDHTKILQIEEFTSFKYNPVDNVTSSQSKVKFSSGFKAWGVKDRIENWSFQRFSDNLKRSRLGLKFVMSEIRMRVTKGQVLDT